MSCNKIKNILPDYVDKDLNPNDNQLVKDHLVHCKLCRDELSYLRKYKKMMMSLEPVKAPDDFLEMVHKGIEKETVLKKIKEFLFVPFNVKVPIEAAGLLLTAVIVFIIMPSLSEKSPVDQLVDLEKTEGRKLADSALKPGVKIVKEKSTPIPGTGADITEKDSRRKTKFLAMNKKMKYKSTLGVAGKPIESLNNSKPELMNFEIAILMKRDVPMDYGDSIMGGVETRSRLKKRKASSKISKLLKSPAMESEKYDEDKFASIVTDRDSKRSYYDIKDKNVEEKQVRKERSYGKKRVVYSDKSLDKIEKVVKKYNGKIVSKIYYTGSKKLKYVILEIPVKKYNAFINNLNRVGTVRKHNLINPVRKQKMVNFRIEMLKVKAVKNR